MSEILRIFRIGGPWGLVSASLRKACLHFLGLEAFCEQVVAVILLDLGHEGVKPKFLPCGLDVLEVLEKLASVEEVHARRRMGLSIGLLITSSENESCNEMQQ